MSTYTVQVFRDSNQWIIEVPEWDVVGQTRTLASAADTCPFTGPVELGRCAGFDLGRRVGVSA